PRRRQRRGFLPVDRVEDDGRHEPILQRLQRQFAFRRLFGGGWFARCGTAEQVQDVGHVRSPCLRFSDSPCDRCIRTIASARGERTRNRKQFLAHPVWRSVRHEELKSQITDRCAKYVKFPSPERKRRIATASRPSLALRAGKFNELCAAFSRRNCDAT